MFYEFLYKKFKQIKKTTIINRIIDNKQNEFSFVVATDI